MQQLSHLFKSWSGQAPATVERLPGAGSNRVYYRLTAPGGQSAVGVVGTSCEENRAFIALARHFGQQLLPVPTVLAVSGDGLRYLQTDLGSLSLFDAIATGRRLGGQYNDHEQQLLRRTIAQLPRLQYEGARGLDFSVCYPQPEFDEMGVMFDLNYFKYCFLKATGVDFHEVKLEACFRQLAHGLLAQTTPTFLYRDFQARNVMLVEGPSGLEPRFIDFQGGRRGPVYYDLASFLWQASAHYPDELRQQLIDEYLRAASPYAALPSRQEFVQRLQLFVLFRTMQVLGAYGFRGYFERKRHFIDSIPPALHNLRSLLAQGACPYDHLAQVLQRVCDDAEPVQQPSTSGPLVVRVFSFSYKKGIPEDTSGNGGGYVFDCRGTHNPGRYEPYKKLTGLDEPVIRFLEDDGEILTFLESAYRLADAHVARYVQRGFTSLMFAFGCTGGQHRSVYSAQHLAEHIHQKFGVEVHLCHREQGIETVFKRTAP